ncbi:hypothetical protein TWF696_008462 [Orbilia brochopaga]|uniref:EGF domain-specific O-linked N-acetylglucosamine transferase n=1 Tax=Orbilia brochopaga TaxID=3140254 RepID=A0AAV9UKG8_9PEZI
MALSGRLLVAVFCLLALLLLTVNYLYVYRFGHELSSLVTQDGSQKTATADVPAAATGEIEYERGREEGYNQEEDGWCANVAGQHYLTNVANTWTISCPPAAGGKALIVCFQANLEEQPDNFCVVKNAVYNPPETPAPAKRKPVERRPKNSTTPAASYRWNGNRERRRRDPNGPNGHGWSVACRLVGEWQHGVQAPRNFPHYFGWTGAGPQLHKIQMGGGSEKSIGEEEKECHPPIMLVQLEGNGNIWHTMMEMWSALLTIEILKRAKAAREAIGLTTGTEGGEWDGTDMQVYMENMASEMHISPIFDLWRLVTGRPPANTTSLAHGCYQAVILPLAGGANPFWKDHWRERTCRSPSLLDSFVDRVLSFYGVDDATSSSPSISHVQGSNRESAPMRVTVIARDHNRVILHLHAYLKALRIAFPAAEISSESLESLTVSQQLRLAQSTDVLIGVTGAGLTHTMFLRRGSAVVELLQPWPFMYYGFANVARMRGVEYLSLHGREIGIADAAKNWQLDDIDVSEEAFVDTVGRAINAVQRRRLAG